MAFQIIRSVSLRKTENIRLACIDGKRKLILRSGEIRLMEQNDVIVEMKGITKVYPNGIAANQDVNFSVRRGEIHALMGENGAGKSTLMKILFGLEQPTEGEIWIGGQKVSLSSPNAAIAHSIGMVHQHFMLVPSLTVAENIVLGMVPKKRGVFIDYKKALEITKQSAEQFNLAVNPDAKVADIPVGMKQKVEILKALIRGAKILILDEPTAVLTTQETAELFRELIHLKERGYTIIFISHKLNEIKQITDRITIMRGGKSMGVYETASITEQEISRLMVGTGRRAGRGEGSACAHGRGAPGAGFALHQRMEQKDAWRRFVRRSKRRNPRRCGRGRQRSARARGHAL